jgi:hypothetical protein
LRSCLFERSTVRDRGYTIHGRVARATSLSCTGRMPVIRSAFIQLRKSTSLYLYGARCAAVMKNVRKSRLLGGI